jgi:hypothetical protein
VVAHAEAPVESQLSSKMPLVSAGTMPGANESSAPARRPRPKIS